MKSRCCTSCMPRCASSLCLPWSSHRFLSAHIRDAKPACSKSQGLWAHDNMLLAALPSKEFVACAIGVLRLWAPMSLCDFWHPWVFVTFGHPWVFVTFGTHESLWLLAPMSLCDFWHPWVFVTFGAHVFYLWGPQMGVNLQDECAQARHPVLLLHPRKLRVCHTACASMLVWWSKSLLTLYALASPEGVENMCISGLNPWFSVLTNNQAKEALVASKYFMYVGYVCCMYVPIWLCMYDPYACLFVCVLVCMFIWPVCMIRVHDLNDCICMYVCMICMICMYVYTFCMYVWFVCM